MNYHSRPCSKHFIYISSMNHSSLPSPMAHALPPQFYRQEKGGSERLTYSLRVTQPASDFICPLTYGILPSKAFPHCLDLAGHRWHFVDTRAQSISCVKILPTEIRPTAPSGKGWRPVTKGEWLQKTTDISVAYLGSKSRTKTSRKPGRGWGAVRKEKVYFTAPFSHHLPSLLNKLTTDDIL